MRLARIVQLGLCAFFVSFALSCTHARGLQVAKLHASLRPERLGAYTTLFVSFQITSIPANDQMPLTGVEFFLPEEVGFATSGLGLVNCVQSRLEELGPPGCPAASLMGRGVATAEIPIEDEPFVESAGVEVFSAKVRNGRLALMVYVEAKSPVSTQLIFPAIVSPASPPFGEGIEAEVPLVPSVPGAPDVAVSHFQMHIGATASGRDRFVYYRWRHNRRSSYVPAGLLLPPSCPRHGFPFKATFAFLDGTTTEADTSVPCPHSRDSSKHG